MRERKEEPMQTEFYAVCPGKNGLNSHIVPITNGAQQGDKVSCLTHGTTLTVEANEDWGRLSVEVTVIPV
ncbi:hypothetical protein IPM62_05160 [Candidatus Woesebacteria bacterium]|nr:MAG: hypothetical protein IPM62_05160 [Candidatus Woesebacteria bacterium]